MPITSANFVKGITKSDPILSDGLPQVAMMGRSNVGKSSVINSLVRRKDLARTSSFAGRTQEINFYLINGSFYLVDLPGYGFARASHAVRENLQELINWYFFNAAHGQRVVVLIIDANVGPTDIDIETLRSLEKERKDIIVVANKIDKIKPSQFAGQMRKIKELVGNHRVIPYSALKKTGVEELTEEILR